MKILYERTQLQFARLKQEANLVAALPRIVNESMVELSGLAGASTPGAIARDVAYRDSMVALYGLLEEVLDDLIVTYFDHLQRDCTRPSDLPEKTITAYKTLASTLIGQLNPRVRQTVGQAELLRSLLAIEEDTAHVLPATVLTLKNSNYRLPYIAECIGRLGVEAGFVARLGQTLDEDLELLQQNDIQSILGVLVERRNELAHTYMVADRLEPALVDAYIRVVESFVLELIAALSSKLVERRIAARGYVPIGTVEKVGDDFMGMWVEDGTVQVGEVLLFSSPAGAYQCGTVSSIHINDNNVHTATAGTDSPTGAGLRFASRMPATKKGRRVYYCGDDLKQLLTEPI